MECHVLHYYINKTWSSRGHFLKENGKGVKDSLSRSNLGSTHINYNNNTIAISRALSPSLESVPSLFLCGNRKMRPPPRVQLDFDFSLLLLLAGDVSLNPGPSVRGLRLGTVNARSMRDKDACSIWPCHQQGHWPPRHHWDLADHKRNLRRSCWYDPPGFLFFQEPRTRRRGGRVGLFVSSAHKFTAISLPTQTSFEAISGKIECGQSCLIILNIYRPPGPDITFFSELQDILSYISTLPYDLALMGDFNLHIDSSSSDAGQLSGILESLWSPSIRWLSYPQSRSFSRPYDLFFQDAMFSLFRPLIWFRTTFLLLLTCKFHPIIVETIPQTIKYRKVTINQHWSLQGWYPKFWTD